ncbi:MAG TPA: PilZ domain-containing protein, partial [Candidatus Dormibacteraeota bacterium]|nr:PilZ domain-containing protein [Candidatus Dormibacteraeota bacterium]
NQERRRNRRRKLTQLVYLEFGRENGGMIRDVSEGGMRFHLMNRVTAGEELRFGITIDPARRIEGKARMIWTDATAGKSGGMAITEMSPESRATMFSWLADIDSPPRAAPAAQAPKTSLSQPSRAGVAADGLSAPATVAPAPAPPSAAQPDVAQSVVTQAPVTQPVATEPVVAQPPVTQAPVASQQAAAVEPPPSVVVPVPDAVQPVPAVPRAPAPASPSPAAPTPASAAPPPPPPPVAPPPPPQPEISTSLFYGIDTDLTRDPGPEPPSLVSHDDWKRAAREMDVQERTSRAPRATTVEERPAPPPSPRRESRKYSELADHVDPTREFLKSPLGTIPEPDPRFDPRPDLRPDPRFVLPPEENELPLPVQAGRRRPRAVSKSRVGVVFLLAVICGLVVAYAVIVYRQPLGRLMISLGQMITGEQSSTLPSEAPAAGPAQRPSTDNTLPLNSSSDTRGNGDKSAAAAVAGSAASVPPQGSTPTQQSGVPVIPPGTKPSTPNATEPLAQAPTPGRQATPQSELTASGKEIISGKPRRLPSDIASLWQAVENGDAVAEVALANRYAAGAGVERNCAQARVLLEAAAKRGNELATKGLRQLRYSGCQ